MIQRKQSLFLLAAALAALVTYLFPVMRYEATPELAYVYRTTGIFTAAGVPVVDAELKFPVAFLFAFIAAVLFASIFFYRNRPRQITVVRASYVLILLSVYLLISQHLSLQAYLSQGRTLSTSPGISLFLPAMIGLFAYLAERGIRNDEQLVKAADRLR